MQEKKKLKLLDKSNYLKGLLLLIRKDRNISKEEKEIFLKIGDMLGFEKTFLRDSIQNILINNFIDDQPPRFSNQELARCFLLDAIKLSHADKEFNNNEIDWIESVAKQNNFDADWVRSQLKNISTSKIDENFYKNLELNKII